MHADGNKKVLQDFVDALERKEIDRALSLCSENALWITPEGEFKGFGELRRYLEWFSENTTGIRDGGIGIVVAGDRGASEHVLEGKSEGEDWEAQAISTFELVGGKINRILTTYDRLSVARQVATAGIAALAVNTIIDKMEEGLH